MGLNKYDQKSLSKYLCFILRHKPEHAKLDMDKHGWVPVEQLITNVNLYSKYCLDNYLLEKIVAEDDKGRYVFDDTYEYIKCCQGHSIPWVEPELKYCSPPSYLYHVTTTEAFEAILKSGAIKKIQRHAVHMHNDINEAWRVAERWDKTPVMLKIAACDMNIDGYTFGVLASERPWGTSRCVTLNGQVLCDGEIWLTEEVPVKYLCDPVLKKVNGKIENVYLEHNRKEIMHIRDVMVGHSSLCLVNNFVDYNRASLEHGYSNYNTYSDTKLLKLNNSQIRGIMDIDTLVRIARLDPSRLTEEQLLAAEHKLRDKVIIDESDVSLILDIIKEKNILYYLPSKDCFYNSNGIRTEDIHNAIKALTIDDFIPSSNDVTPRYIGDVVLTFKPKNPLFIGAKLRIDEPMIQIKVETDRNDYDTMILVLINAPTIVH